MTEKTPITPDEIQAGDVIRFEWGLDKAPATNFGESAEFWAVEYRAIRDGSTGGWEPNEGTFYLLHRPTRPESPVPTEDTLGWVHQGGRLLLGVWRTHDHSFSHGVGRSVIQWEKELRVDTVTGFTPAVAIPAEPTGAMLDVYKKAWHEADARGEHGERVAAGLRAVIAHAQGGEDL